MAGLVATFVLIVVTVILYCAFEVGHAPGAADGVLGLSATIWTVGALWKVRRSRRRARARALVTSPAPRP